MLTGAPAADSPVATYGDAALVTVGLGATWTLARGVLPISVECPTLAATGVPCPFCGLTRLAGEVARGDVIGAVTADPAGLVVLGLLAVVALAGAARRLGWTPRGRPWVRAVGALGAVALASHWLTVLAGGGFVDA